MDRVCRSNKENETWDENWIAELKWSSVFFILTFVAFREYEVESIAQFYGLESAISRDHFASVTLLGESGDVNVTRGAFNLRNHTNVSWRSTIKKYIVYYLTHYCNSNHAAAQLNWRVLLSKACAVQLVIDWSMTCLTGLSLLCKFIFDIAHIDLAIPSLSLSHWKYMSLSLSIFCIFSTVSWLHISPENHVTLPIHPTNGTQDDK